MRIFIYIFFLCVAPVVSFGQSPDIISPPSSFDCGDGYLPLLIEQKDLVMPSELSHEKCITLSNNAQGYSAGGKYQMAYDTLKYYIEHCAMEKESWMEFGTISSNAGPLIDMYKETAVNYREWLKSVLYLNPDTLYYCSDAIQIAASYGIGNDSVGVDGDAGATVTRFLMDSTNCRFFAEEIIDTWEYNRYWQTKTWRDTVTDSLKTPLDTGYTTIDALGLQILRGPMNSVSADITKPLQRNPISEAIVIPNPIKDEMELRYKLTEGALVKIEIYDALGKQMYSMAQGYKPKGDNLQHFDTRTWSSGSYYIRMTTLGGEVKTVKVVRE